MTFGCSAVQPPVDVASLRPKAPQIETVMRADDTTSARAVAAFKAVSSTMVVRGRESGVIALRRHPSGFVVGVHQRLALGAGLVQPFTHHGEPYLDQIGLERW